MPSVVGIDAGGSHSRAICVTHEGEVVGIGAGGPANTFFTPEETALHNIEQAARQVLSGGNVPEAGCLAGPNLPPDAIDVLQRVAPETQWLVVTEDAACRAAVFGDAKGAGCVVQCGTGTFAEGAWSNGQRVRRGGWGPVVGDEGSGTMIAIEGLRAIVRAAEGRGPFTMLTDTLLAACGLTQISKLKEFLYRPFIARDRLAALCPVVAQAAEADDPVACDILTRAGRDLAELAAAVLLAPEAPNSDLETALFGGVVQNVPFVADVCIEHLRNRLPETRVQTPLLLPVDGTIAIAFAAAKADAHAVLQNIAARRRAETMPAS